ncbi:hypothetical protein OSTOST_22415 [Ostertagia ostertagi]
MNTEEFLKTADSRPYSRTPSLHRLRDHYRRCCRHRLLPQHGHAKLVILQEQFLLWDGEVTNIESIWKQYQRSVTTSETMRLLWCVYIEEPDTRICSLRIPNRPLATIFAMFQLTHVFSIYKYRDVFFCRSGVPANASIEEKYMAYDVIIFDFGLMHRVLGTEECVANYLGTQYLYATISWNVSSTVQGQ